VSSRELKIIYSGDASGALKAVDQIEKANAGLGDKMKAVGSKIAGVGKTMTLGLTLPLVGLGAAAIKEFGEASKGIAQTAQVIKSTGGAANVTERDIDNLTSRLGKLAVVDDDVVREGANMLLTFTNIRNEVGKGNNIFDQATKVALNMSTALGTDLAGQSIQLGKALNDPIKGITALSKVGVTFTEQQRKQIEAMVEAGDTMGAQKLILAELNKEFGGQAKAAGDAATPMQRLSVAFGDIAEKVGSLLMPFLEKLSGWLQSAISWFQGLSPEAQRLATTIGLIAAAVGPVLLVVGKLVSAFGAVGAAFRALSAIFLTSPWGIVAAAVIALVVVIVKNWDHIKEFLLKVWNAIKQAASTVWNAIKGALTTVWEAIKTAITTYVNFYKAIFEKAWDAIKTVARTVWGAIRTVIIEPLQFIREKIGNALDAIRETWHNVWNRLKEIASGVWEGIKGAARSALNVLIGIVRGLVAGWNVLIRGFNRIPLVPDIPELTPPDYLARGTQSFRGGLAIVGELGPELVRLPRGSAVETAARTREMLGGTTLVVNVNVGGSVIAERDLMRQVRKAALEGARRNAQITGFA
jgi:phage-related protein